MIARAIARFVRVSPRKTRYVLDVIRGKNVERAFDILRALEKGAAFYVTQVLKSALDGAIKKTKGSADASNLFISKITADGGPMLKRYKAGSMGRAMPIKRRTSHILVELDMISAKASGDRQSLPRRQAGIVHRKDKKEKTVKTTEKHTKKLEAKANVAAKR